MPHHQPLPGPGLRRMLGIGGGQQVGHQHGGFALAAIARIGALVADVEHVLRGGEQLQEQEAVVVAGGAVAAQASAAGQVAGQAVQATGRIAAREGAIVHAQQADRAERQQPHRYHARDADPAGEQRRTGIGLAQGGGEVRAHQLGRHRGLDTGALRIGGEGVDQRAQAVERAAGAGRGRRARQQRVEQAEQALAPALRGQRLVQRARVPGQHPQQPHEGVERVQRAAFEFGHRRDHLAIGRGDRRVAAAGVAQQQAVQGEGPGVGIVGRGLEPRAVRGVQAPARAGGVQPGVQAVEGRRVQAGGLGQRRAGQQVQGLDQAEARHRQRQQAQEHLGQRLAGQRAGVGHGVGDRVAAPARAEHRLQIGQVGVDVRGQHRDLARLQRRVEARVLEQRAQLVVQHLQLAQPGVAGVHLQAGIVQTQRRQAGARVFGRGLRRRRGAAVEQVRLQPPQQAALQRAAALARVGIAAQLHVRMHHLVVAQHRHEVAPGRAPGQQQRVLAGSGVRVAVACALQVAPVVAAGRGHVQVQGAHPRLGGDHPQHVGRDVEDGEGEQAPGQARGQRPVALAEAAQVGVDAARTVGAAAGHAAPQRGLRIVRRLARLPGQQPLAAPGLVLLEGLGQFAGQRPGLERVGRGFQIGAQRLQGALAQDGRIGQRGVDAPAQRGRVQVLATAGHVGIQRPLHELAGGQEFQVGGHPVLGRQGGLQPAPHRHLRDQHHVRCQRRCRVRGRAQGLRQDAGQHLQRVGMVEAEVDPGGVVHACRHCAGERPRALGGRAPEPGARAPRKGRGWVRTGFCLYFGASCGSVCRGPRVLSCAITTSNSSSDSPW